jgi:hypothetical protein
MTEAIRGEVVADLPAGILWAALRIAGAGDGPLAIVTIRPAKAAGFVTVEAVSDCRAMVLSLEVANPAELPRTVGIYSADLQHLKRKTGRDAPQRIRIETASGGDPREGPLLLLRPSEGLGGQCLLVSEAEPLEPLPLAPLPSPWWEPGPAIPAPVLLNLPRWRRRLQALEDAGIGPAVELIVTADDAAVGIAVRPWADDPPAWGSAQLARCVRVPPDGMR